MAFANPSWLRRRTRGWPYGPPRRCLLMPLLALSLAVISNEMIDVGRSSATQRPPLQVLSGGKYLVYVLPIANYINKVELSLARPHGLSSHCLRSSVWAALALSSPAATPAWSGLSSSPTSVRPLPRQGPSHPSTTA